MKYFLFLILVLNLNCKNNYSEISAKFNEGVWDSSQVEWNQQIIQLSGDWEFVWDEFIDPKSIQFDKKISKSIFIPVPGRWNLFQLDHTRPNPGWGYGTYRLRITNLPIGIPLELHFQSVSTSFKMYLDGKEIIERGKVSTTPLGSESDETRAMITFISKPSIEILIHVSNYSHSKGGLWNSIYIGKSDLVTESQSLNFFKEGLTFGIILIMGIYHLVLYFLRKSNLTPLYFAIICILISIRTICLGEQLIYDFFPSLPLSIKYKIEYTDFILTSLFILLFYKNLFAKVIHDRINLFFNVFSIIILGLSIFALLLDTEAMTNNVNIFQIPLIITTVICIILMVFGIFNSVDGSKSLTFFSLIFIITVTNDILLALDMIKSTYLGQFGFLALVFGQAVVLSMRFSSAFDEVEDLTENLEKKVIHRTKELESANQLVEKKKKELESLNQLISNVNSVSDLDDIMSFILYHLELEFSIQYTALLVQDEKSKSFKTLSFYQTILENGPSSFFYFEASERNSIFQKSFESGKIFHFDLKDNEFSESEDFKHYHLKNTITIPLIVYEKIFGFLLLSKKGDWLVEDNEKDRLDSIAHSISGPIFNSLLFQEAIDAKKKAEEALIALEESKKLLSQAEKSASFSHVVSHLAHEVNNPLNYISTGHIIAKDALEEGSNFILNSIPQSDDTLPFRNKIEGYFRNLEEGLSNTLIGAIKIKDVISEIRAISMVDGIGIRNIDIGNILLDQLTLSLEKNQISKEEIEITINGLVYPQIQEKQGYFISSQKEILSRSIRTLLSHNLFFAKKNHHPKLKISIHSIPGEENQSAFILSISNNGESIKKEEISQIFDITKSKSYGAELIGLAFIKELLKSIQGNISITDLGQNSGFTEYQIFIQDYVKK